jgi:hypothetical protein
MNTSHTPLPFEDEPIEPQAKPHRLLVRGVQVWGLLCAVLFFLALYMQWMRVQGSGKPIRWREIVAWVCFDALFFLGAYAAFRLLCGGSGTDSSDDDPDK